MRKKFTMLLASLLACVGAMKAQTEITNVTQLSNDKVYSIVPRDDTRGAMYATSTSQYLDACGGTKSNAANPSVAINANSEDQQFALYTHEGSMYLFSVGAGKFVSEVTGNLFPLVEQPGHAVAVESSDTEGYFIIKAKGTEFINVSTGWSSGCVAGWNQIDDGNRLKITEVSAMPAATLAQLTAAFSKQVDLTYVYKYGQTEWGRETVEATKGEAYPTPAARYGVTYSLPEGTVASDATDGTEVEVTCTLAEDFPFAIAETYNAETAKWYALTLRNKKVVYNGSAFVYSDEVTTGGFFTFTGNPFSGYTIYNYDGGSKALWATPGNGTVIGLEEAASGTWELLGTSAADNYLLKVKGTDNSYMHDYGSKFSYWLSNSAATDAGSYVTITSPIESLQALVEKAELVTSSANSKVGTISASSAATLATALTNAEAITEANSLTEILNATSSLQTAYQTALEDVVLPEESKYYTLVSSCTNDHRAGQSVYVNSDGRMQFARSGEVASDFARIFQFIPATDGKFYIYNVENNTYMNTVGYALATGVDAAKPVTITNLGKDNIVKIVPDGQNMMHTQDAGSVIVGWNNNSYTDGSAWRIVETEAPDLAEAVMHTLTVTKAGWATLVLGHNMTIPAEVKAYAVSKVEDGKAILDEVSGVLPAHTPVLIEAVAEDYVFNYTTETNTIETNLLEGSVFNINVSEEGYVLAAKDGDPGLYKAKYNRNDLDTKTDADGDGDATNDYTAFLNNAKKAYLPASVVPDASAPMFSFDRGEGTTEIENSELKIENSAVIYDLLGRRVEKMEKGIYIVNGKKVVIK